LWYLLTPLKTTNKNFTYIKVHPLDLGDSGSFVVKCGGLWFATTSLKILYIKRALFFKGPQRGFLPSRAAAARGNSVPGGLLLRGNSVPGAGFF
jgi:hypothetical protein